MFDRYRGESFGVNHCLSKTITFVPTISNIKLSDGNTRHAQGIWMIFNILNVQLYTMWFKFNTVQVILQPKHLLILTPTRIHIGPRLLGTRYDPIYTNVLKNEILFTHTELLLSPQSIASHAVFELAWIKMCKICACWIINTQPVVLILLY